MTGQTDAVAGDGFAAKIHRAVTGISPARSIILILFVAFGVYSNALHNGFFFDDFYQVLENVWIRDTKHIFDIFSTNSAACIRGYTLSYYRPLMYVFYMLCCRIAGVGPWCYHLLSILFHCGVS